MAKVKGRTVQMATGDDDDAHMQRQAGARATPAANLGVNILAELAFHSHTSPCAFRSDVWLSASMYLIATALQGPARRLAVQTSYHPPTSEHLQLREIQQGQKAPSTKMHKEESYVEDQTSKEGCYAHRRIGSLRASVETANRNGFHHRVAREL
ncbi:hypothetical protein P280DRAFT_481927 [Massarina eburnea CBS 473.64]|uniref:Uncharacterized protein n=1 Tax=Massarina eburnea CBS 473.64 TaxID=1395130 RepID=A0A6A6RX87_9PLEO|nr:hypothetical protein P280DRAFT_481927 [Massarina eburnea CBS 473.64]